MLIFIPILGYNVVRYYQQIDDLNHSINHLITTANSAASEEINAYLLNSIQAFQIIARQIDQCGVNLEDSNPLEPINSAVQANHFFSLFALLDTDGRVKSAQTTSTYSNRHILTRNIEELLFLTKEQIVNLHKQAEHWLDHRLDIQILLDEKRQELTRLISEGQINSPDYRQLQNQISQLTVNSKHVSPAIHFGGAIAAKASGLPFHADSFIYSKAMINCAGTVTGFYVVLLDWTAIENILFKYARRINDSFLKTSEVFIWDAVKQQPLTVVSEKVKSAYIDSTHQFVEFDQTGNCNSESGYISCYKIPDSSILGQAIPKIWDVDNSDSNLKKKQSNDRSLFYVLTYIPSSEVDTIVTQRLTDTIIWILVTFLVFIAVVLILTKKITGPISLLSRTMTDLANGDVKARSTIQNNDELGMLSSRFNDMADAIQNQQIKLESHLSILKNTLESVGDGILVIDSAGKITLKNDQFINLWKIPSEIANHNDDKVLLDYALDQLIDPDSFIQKVMDLYATPDAFSEDILYFKDGRVFERYSQP